MKQLSMSQLSRPRERGAAALVVVMILFLIMALLAAYSNRSLLFEQRIASGYYRAALAQEAAESAIEWTVSMLNSPALDASCTALPLAGGGVSFRDRYLVMNSDRRIQARPPVVNAAAAGAHAECVRRSDGSLQCKCPAVGAGAVGLLKSVALADAAEPQPSFVVRLNTSGRPGVLQVFTLGCSGSAASGECADWQTALPTQVGAASNRGFVALVSALKAPPAAPLTVGGTLDVSGGGAGLMLALHNAEPRSAGLLLVTGEAVTGLLDSDQESLPGTPVASAKLVDATLSKTLTPTADPLKMFLGMPLSRYSNQPALRTVTCAGDCGPALLSAYQADSRLVLINGPATLTNQTLGSLPALPGAPVPMMIIVNGNLTLNGPFNLTGMLVVNGNLTWTNGGGVSLISGAVLVTGKMTTNGKLDIYYRGSVIDALNNQLGSFVRVPGSWFDLGASD